MIDANTALESITDITGRCGNTGMMGEIEAHLHKIKELAEAYKNGGEGGQLGTQAVSRCQRSFHELKIDLNDLKNHVGYWAAKERDVK